MTHNAGGIRCYECGLFHSDPAPERICDCEGAFTQTVHESNAEGHQVGCPRWGIRQVKDND